MTYSKNIKKLSFNFADINEAVNILTDILIP
jgi:hypothetical protein